jgi:hypothetical protein
VRAHYTQLARELKQQSEVANPQEQKISRRSAKNKRRSRASSRQSSGESSRQSSDQLSSNSLPGVPDSLADPVDAIIHQRAE